MISRHVAFAAILAGVLVALIIAGTGREPRPGSIGAAVHPAVAEYAG